MAKRTEHPKSWLTLHQQQRSIIKWTPFLICHIRRGVLSCLGTFRPTVLSREYQVEIAYRFGYPPFVRVVTPTLQQHPAWKHIPHLNGDGSLCLYFPDLREWGPHLHIAKTIVPWTTLWLFYYETWLATGELGGWGGHPAPIDQREFIGRSQFLAVAANRAGSWGGSSDDHRNSLFSPGSRRLLRNLTKNTYSIAA